MATQRGVSQSIIYSIMKNALHAKLEKICKVYESNAAEIDKKATMFVASFNERLNCDESFCKFNLGGSYCRHRVCYIQKGHGNPSKLKCAK